MCHLADRGLWTFQFNNGIGRSGLAPSLSLRWMIQGAHVNYQTESGIKGWWRWPLLPFAAVAGGMTGAFLANLFTWFGMKLRGGYSEDGWFYLYVMPVLSSALFGYLYTAIACHMAPRGKLIAGTVMVTALGLFGLLSIVLAWTLPDYGTLKATQATVSIIAMMIAAIVALMDDSHR